MDNHQQTFNINLSLVLAHSIFWEQKQELLAHGINTHTLQMGTGSPPGVQESTGQMLQAYTQNLPALLQATANQSGPVAQTLQNTSNTIAPQQQALESSLYGQYAPELYNIGNHLNSINSAGGINTAISNITGAGGQLATDTENLQKQLDPEYYATRAAAGSQVNNLLNSIDLNGLSGSERAEVERSNAQQDAQRGILNSPSQTATTQNAMNFGSALQAKRNSLANAISTATSFLPSSQGPVNAFNVGSGAASAPATNPGASMFLGAGQSGDAQAQAQNNALGSGLLNSTSSTSQNNASLGQQARTQVLGSLPSF